MNSNRSFEKRALAALAFALLAATAGLGADEALAPNSGYAEPYKMVTISAGETGVIAEMLVNEGDAVKEGQVLARLETNVLKSDREIAKAELKRQATHLSRLDELAKTNRVTPEELEKSRTDVTVREAELTKIEAMIENRTMRSPVNGVVTEIKRNPAEAVSPSTPQVLTVVQIDKLIVNLYLPPAVAARLAPGQGTRILFLDRNEEAPAQVDFVSPITDAASGTVRVKFVIDNGAGKYRSGARCSLAAARS